MNQKGKAFFSFLYLPGLLGFLLTFQAIECMAQEKFRLSSPTQLTRIEFVVDGSQSMDNQWDHSSRLGEARRILGKLCDSLSQLPNVELALRMYGHQFPPEMANCKDTKLEVHFAKKNSKFIKGKMALIKAKGITPIAYTLERCATDFPKTPSRNVVILITDGEESCHGDPCAVARELQKKNIILKPFVIGLGMHGKSADELQCIGKYFDAPDATTFEKVLVDMLEEVLSNTTAEVDLLDTDGKPTETNVGMTFYDTQTMGVRYVMYHTLNGRGNPDTINIDPVSRYNLSVHTIPPQELNDIEIVSNQHNKITLNAPQGSIKVTSPTKETIKCLVKKADATHTLHIQDVNTTERYITGTYDLEILTLPRIVMKDVKVSQSRIASIQIPPPGKITVNKNTEGFGGIFYFRNNNWEKIYELQTKAIQETIDLQPGSYRLVYRSKLRRNMKESSIKDFSIKSNLTTTVQF